MAVIDASVYVALVHEDEPGHEDSWGWLEGVQNRREPLKSPNILAAEVASAISRGTGNRELAHQIVLQLLRRTSWSSYRSRPSWRGGPRSLRRITRSGVATRSMWPWRSRRTTP